MIAGAGNWVESGSTFVPPEWSATVMGADPGFADFGSVDLRPAAGSPLRDAGPGSTPGVAGREFPGGLFPPGLQPLTRAVGVAGRPADGPLDIGAFEFGTPGSAGGGGSPTTPPAAVARPGFRRAARRPKVVRRGRRYVVDTGIAAACTAACGVVVTSRAGGARVSVPAGATRRLRFTMKSKYARALRRSGRLRVRVAFRASSTGAPVRKLRRTLTLKAP